MFLEMCNTDGKDELNSPLPCPQGDVIIIGGKSSTKQ